MNIPKIKRPGAGWNGGKYNFAAIGAGTKRIYRVKSREEANRVQLAALQFGARKGIKFITRKDDHTVTVIRER